jgi:hypothetical protein
MRIHVRIDRVFLDGVGIEPRHAAVLREAIGAELTRLSALTPASAWGPSRRERRVHGAVGQLSAPHHLGAATARALHGALVGGRR